MTQTMLEVTPEFDLPESKGSSKNLLLAGGLAAVLALGGGGYVLLSGGGEDSSGPVVTSQHQLPVHTLAKKPTTAAKKAVVPPVTSAPIGRDPFKPLYVAPVGGGAAATSTTTATGTSTTPTSTGDSTVSALPYALTLVKVTGGTNGSAPLFTWNVGGTVKTVIAAQKFGKYGELVTLTYVKSSTGKVVGAVVQVGDDEPVPVKLGEKITVK